VNVLADREVDCPPEGIARRVAQAPAHALGATREPRVEVDVGDVHETHAPK
jgi:hypothetical protein